MLWTLGARKCLKCRLEMRKGFACFAGSLELSNQRYSAGSTTADNLYIFIMSRYTADLQYCCAIQIQYKKVYLPIFISSRRRLILHGFI